MSKITLGMHVVEADGQVGVISGWKVVPGVKTMYNLEVAQDHTFAVGAGQWVVHNCDPEKIAASGSGTLRDLASKGYKMSDHFVDEFLKEKGLSTGDIENILKDGDYYHRFVDTFNRITGKTLGRNPRIFTIVHNQFTDELHTIFQGGIPSNTSSFEWLPNPFDP